MEKINTIQAKESPAAEARTFAPPAKDKAQTLAAAAVPLRAALLSGAGDAAAMRSVLERVMDGAQAELCAYYAAAEFGVLHVLVENSRLSVLVPAMGEKLATSFRMFANRRSDPQTCRQHVHYRRGGDAGAGPYGQEPALESFFIVPVLSGPAVGGVLLVGSVRRDAFERETIVSLLDLATAREAAAPGTGGKGRGSLPAAPGETLLSLPYAAALVDADGNFEAANPLMERLLAPGGVAVSGRDEDAGLTGDPGAAAGQESAGGESAGLESSGLSAADKRPDIERLRGFDLRGLWEEFELFGRSIVDRRVNSEGDPRRSISVSLVRMERLSGKARSLLVVRDTSEAAGREREREELLAVVAHEIRTPMTALRNALSMLLEGVPGGGSLRGGGNPRRKEDARVAGASAGSEGEDCTGVRAEDGSCPDDGDLAGPGKDKSQRRLLETALRTVDRLAVLVDGLVETSPVRPNLRTPHLERVEMLRFLGDAVVLFGNSIRRKGIALDIDVDQSATLAYLDRGMIERVIQNLLSNSLRHVPVGGRINITARRHGGAPAWSKALLPDALAPATDFIVLRVADSGPGIPAEVAERINAPAGVGADSIRPARGLGLSIAARLVCFHGGRLIIEGHGPGSSVELYLPADEATSGTMRAVLAARSALHGLIESGAAPVLVTLTKDDPVACWLEIAAGMSERPLVNPAADEICGPGVCFWPLGERLALAVTAARRHREDPFALFGRARRGLRLVGEGARERLEIGWAAYPLDGFTYESLLQAATGRMLKGAAGPLRKGAWE